MIYVVIVIAIIIGAVSCIAEDGGVVSKLVLTSIVASIAFLLLRWITGFEIMITLAKVCGAAIVLLLLFAILRKIF
ncbi:MAG: hypothetical protein IKU84_03950 [Clostridia bacterium]|nr:hypothetical protein [Clostridia bacterium]